jgi:hypothetical protein
MLRLWHVLAASNAVLLAGLIWTTAHSQPAALPATDVLRARLIELVDENGRPRAQLHLGVDGGGQLRLIGGNGEVRVKLGTSMPDGSGLILMDRRTEPVVVLAADERGPALILADANGKVRRVEP